MGKIDNRIKDIEDQCDALCEDAQKFGKSFFILLTAVEAVIKKLDTLSPLANQHNPVYKILKQSLKDIGED